MTVAHHPTEATLAAFAAGTLDEGRMLVVAAHLAACPDCRRSVRMLEATGGVMLDDLAPADFAADGLVRAMAQLDAPPAAPVAARRAETIPGLMPAHARLLAPYDLGPWRWVGPGVSWRMVDAPTLPGGRVFLLKATGGTALPDHTHTGTELTCVLTGAFRHEHGRYGPGDIDEADDEVDHTPVVEAGSDCICLVAMQGRLKLNGLLGRVLQPFVRL
ncbi:MAG: cupin domain-containing protein [Rhodoplanes sp.]|uniref:ChrR family anti-sigma-E factor n=1 Tax=Rhodoplanes sp. TaxID=1968906 RepID=UPI0017D32C45|nr:ChrR family anti-sigma-E factor [Rhodoplanes sp.]NVO17402.1 cupin domain-containing protein [Rhodoplanes sp.]